MASGQNRVIPRSDSFVESSVPNPFEYNIKLSIWEKLQVVLASVTIVPIRAFFMFFFLLLAWPVAYFATYGIENDLGKEPLTGWRRIDRLFATCLRVERGSKLETEHHSRNQAKSSIERAMASNCDISRGNHDKRKIPYNFQTRCIYPRSSSAACADPLSK